MEVNMVNLRSENETPVRLTQKIVDQTKCLFLITMYRKAKKSVEAGKETCYACDSQVVTEKNGEIWFYGKCLSLRPGESANLPSFQKLYENRDSGALTKN